MVRRAAQRVVPTIVAFFSGIYVLGLALAPREVVTWRAYALAILIASFITAAVWESTARLLGATPRRRRFIR